MIPKLALVTDALLMKLTECGAVLNPAAIESMPLLARYNSISNLSILTIRGIQY